MTEMSASALLFVGPFVPNFATKTCCSSVSVRKHGCAIFIR